MARSGRAWSALVVFLVTSAAHPHHSRSAFDLDRTVQVSGVVTEVAWTNPHYYLSVMAPGTPEPRQWTFEGHSVPGLVRNGWAKDTVQVGQQIAVVANPNKDPDIPFGLLDHVTRPDGETYYSFKPRPGDGRSSASDVTPSTDFSGTWRLIRSLRNNLVGGFGAPTDWPLTAQAQAALATYSMHDDPSLRCEPRGLPRMLHWPYAQRWHWRGDTLVVEVEHSTQERLVFAQLPEGSKADENGVSQYTRQANGELIITSRNFVATKWGSTRGVDSSSAKQLTERYTLTDGGRVMELTYTIVDPQFLTKPVQQQVRYAKVNDFAFAQEPPCDTYTAQRHLQFETR